MILQSAICILQCARGEKARRLLEPERGDPLGEGVWSAGLRLFLPRGSCLEGDCLSELPWSGGADGESHGGSRSEHGAVRHLSHGEKGKHRLLDVP